MAAKAERKVQRVPSLPQDDAFIVDMEARLATLGPVDQIQDSLIRHYVGAIRQRLYRLRDLQHRDNINHHQYALYVVEAGRYWREIVLRRDVLPLVIRALKFDKPKRGHNRLSREAIAILMEAGIDAEFKSVVAQLSARSIVTVRGTGLHWRDDKGKPKVTSLRSFSRGRVASGGLGRGHGGQAGYDGFQPGGDDGRTRYRTFGGAAPSRGSRACGPSEICCLRGHCRLARMQPTGQGDCAVCGGGPADGRTSAAGVEGTLSGPDDHALIEALGGRTPAGFSREDRVALIGAFAQAMLTGQTPSPESVMFVVGGIASWLESGGSLEKDYWRISGEAGSHRTPQRLWRNLSSRGQQDGGEAGNVVETE
jgi:hypothetical protein